jgi:serine/threonine protein kinase
LLGTPNIKIWPELAEMPLYSTIQLPKYAYDTLKETFYKSADSELDLLESFLVYRPQNRISARRALLHEYFDQSPKACPPILLPTYPELRNKRKRESEASNSKMSVFDKTKQKI